MAAVLAIALVLLAGARTPHDAVLRFIENHSPKDACAQLAPAYERAIAKQYGPCLQGMRVQPKATHVRTYNEKIHGARATVDASYDASGQKFTELYSLEKTHGIWLITGSKQIP
ncbi:MAG TPA: hypothetical protein VFB25_00060 [Gaiellaceae bacterium]|nr:hypothetical protein [Gaiellaceae bacterium]